MHKQRQFSVYLALPIISVALLIAAIYVSVQSFISEPDNDSNQMCPVIPLKSTASTKNDVIFFMATGTVKPELKLAIKSLKSTGTQAKLVLITDVDFNPSIEDATFLKQSDVELYRRVTPPINKTIVPHMIRYKYEYEWLLNHTLISRVFHSDAYDVYFQKDPFGAASLNKEKLTFVVEPHPIRSCGWNQNWFESCYGDRELLKYKNEFIICSGSIIGNATEYIKLLEIMLNTSEWDKCYGISMDQPILNHLVWSGELKEKGVNYKFTGCDGGFMTVQWCVVNRMVNINDKGQILSPAGHVPAYLHQYNRVDKLEKYLYKSCQMKKPKRK